MRIVSNKFIRYFAAWLFLSLLLLFITHWFVGKIILCLLVAYVVINFKRRGYDLRGLL